MTAGFAIPEALRSVEGPDDFDELVHFLCDCDDDRALCGADMTDCEWLDSSAAEDQCVVCLDLLARPCEKCGETLE